MSELARSAWYFFTKYFISLLPNPLFVNFIFMVNAFRLRRPYYWVNINNPKTFTEKMNWLKLNQPPVGADVLADKYLVRNYVERIIGGEYLVQLLAVYESAHQIQYEQLPQQFVLKANHGSGWNIICEDKSTLDRDRVTENFTKWLKRNPFYISKESQYKEIKPLIVCESFLGTNINDYKLFCFKGDVKLIQVDLNRFNNHRRNFYTPDWKLLDIEMVYRKHNQAVEKPEQLNDMILNAEKLSKDCDFVRVDFYCVNNIIYFGEMTFFPEGGFGPFDSYDSDLIVGNLLIIDNLS